MSSTALLERFGWNDRVAHLVREVADPDLRPARLVTVDRGLITVVTDDAELRLESRGLDATAGDWLLVTATDPPAVAHVLPRWSALRRHDAGRTSAPQVLAANLDLCLVVVGLDRDANPRRLDRLLTSAWDSGALPVIVQTKADLATTTRVGAEVAAVVEVEVITTSVRTGEGLARLRSLVTPGITAALIGESGAGKSSLANALVGEVVLRTAAVRDGDRKGRHTTRARHLVPIPGAGVLLDTPGIRGVGLTTDENAGLERAFADVAGLAPSCRFNDCTHGSEPGCAVTAAVADGELAEERLTSYLRLRHEQQAAAVRADVRLARDRSREFGRNHKQTKEHLRRTRGGDK